MPSPDQFPSTLLYITMGKLPLNCLTGLSPPGRLLPEDAVGQDAIEAIEIPIDILVVYRAALAEPRRYRVVDNRTVDDPEVAVPIGDGAALPYDALLPLSKQLISVRLPLP